MEWVSAELKLRIYVVICMNVRFDYGVDAIACLRYGVKQWYAIPLSGALFRFVKVELEKNLDGNMVHSTTMWYKVLESSRRN